MPVAAEIAATSNYNAANASPAVTDKGALLATLPLIVLFLACGRFFIAGIASGSIKDRGAAALYKAFRLLYNKS